MFPAIVPSKNNGCASSSSVLSSFVTGASSLLVPGRVTAVRKIPQGTLSSAINPESLVDQPHVQQVGGMIILKPICYFSIFKCQNLKDVIFDNQFSKCKFSYKNTF